MRTLTLRLKDQAYAQLEQEAANKGVGTTELLRQVIEARYGLRPRGPFEATATIPYRMLEVERWFGLSITDSVLSLAGFGIQSVADLATPERLLAGIDEEKLTAFAERYEVELDWLRTGEGPTYRATHAGWYTYEVARRIVNLWIAGELTRVRFVCNQTGFGKGERTEVIVALGKRHPLVTKHPREPVSVNESFPVVFWDQDQRWLLANLILFCRNLFHTTHAQEVNPLSVTITARAFWDVRRGRLHLAQALRDHTVHGWEPVSEAEQLDASSREFGDRHDWRLLCKLEEDALTRWRGRKEVLGEPHP